ncbi:MAG: Unknown protein [uncultured Campylobacterales bacterium]|uniref:NfeD-like C-terminal domain-containing protein n=1 Tax=uncultured Campylobacterales bacterium TaxID=352960 RepID=A0A6S6SP09_9BACT|nr:MAG: Unknown protein [uncultured Campylobacterales bacterium]
MDPLSSLILLSLGILFIAVEAMIYSFYIIWFGFGLILTALIQLIYPIEQFWIQLGVASIISILLFVIFYKPFKNWLNKEPINEVKDDFIKIGGTGIIKNNMLFYQGIYFKVMDTDISEINNKSVKVLKIEKNNAWIEIE